MKQNQYRTRLTEYREQIKLQNLYTKEFKIKILKFLVLLILIMALLYFIKFASSTDPKNYISFLNSNSQLINIFLTFLLFLTTSIYVFLTHRYVSLTKELIVANSKQGIYEIRPQLYIDLFKLKVVNIESRRNSTKDKDDAYKEDLFSIEFPITIHCYGRGPAIFPKIEFITLTEDQYIRSVTYKHEHDISENVMPENIQPFSKVTLNVVLRTNVKDLTLVKDDFLELNLTYNDISGNLYCHKLFYSISIDHYFNFFNLLHESISFNGKFIHISDSQYSWQKLNFTS